MTTRFHLHGVPPALGLALAVASCGSEAMDPTESQLADDGTQAMIASAQSTAISSVVFDAVTATAPADAAVNVVTPVKAWPWGCVSRAAKAAPSVGVTLTFNACTGPFGLLDITGTESVTFSNMGQSGALRASMGSFALASAGSAIQHHSTTDFVSAAAGSRTVIWQGSWARTNDQGERVSHTADLRITVDHATGCRTSDGTAATTVGARSVNTVISGYSVCRNATTGLEGCPTGSVVHTGMPSGRTVSVQYDGSAVAQVTGARGNTWTVALACTPSS